MNSITARVIKAVQNEAEKPETYVKGEVFQNYVRAHLFPKDKYKLLARTADYTSSKEDYAESTNLPDFQFESLATGRQFFVEAKFRSTLFKGMVEWSKHYQLARYRKLNSTTPVYVAIGFQGEPNAPEKLYFIPLKEIKYPSLYPSFLAQYEILATSPVSDTHLK